MRRLGVVLGYRMRPGGRIQAERRVAVAGSEDGHSRAEADRVGAAATARCVLPAAEVVVVHDIRPEVEERERRSNCPVAAGEAGRSLVGAEAGSNPAGEDRREEHCMVAEDKAAAGSPEEEEDPAAVRPGEDTRMRRKAALESVSA